jgi:1-acyl-sn-glycerol-3-phosphate acyltransferase
MRWWFYDTVKFLSWAMLRLGYGLDVQGTEHVPQSGAFVVASNHVSYLDPLVIGVACPRRVRFMARSSLFRHVLLGWFLRSTRVIPLARGEADVGAVREAVRRLRHGEPIGLFPEGTRQLTGQLSQAKRGVGLIASMAKVPIVPVLVRGTFEALPPGSGFLRPAKIRVAFGEQIAYTNSPHHEALAAAVTQSWRRLAQTAVSASTSHP